MNAAVLPAPPPTGLTVTPPPAAAVPIAVPPVTPKPFRWTCDDFHDMCDAGVMEGRNVFLVNGVILEMPPPGPPHDAAVGLTDYALKALFAPPGYWVRIQTGLVLGLAIDPVPDLAVVVGTPRSYPTHPRTAVLVVEVSDSSLAYDRGDKANLYAAAGVTDYWVIDVVNGRVQVFRDPTPDPAVPFGAYYVAATAHAPGDSIRPLALPAASVAVADLLP